MPGMDWTDVLHQKIDRLQAENKLLKQQLTDAKVLGWQECLGSVRASLCVYPNGGGDIEVMKEVGRLLSEAKQDTSLRSDALCVAHSYAWSARSHLRLEEFAECEDRLNKAIVAIDAARAEGGKH